MTNKTDWLYEALNNYTQTYSLHELQQQTKTKQQIASKNNGVLEINSVAKSKAVFPSHILTHSNTILKTMVGSMYICSPPPEDSDEDWLCFVKNLPGVLNKLKEEGWEIGGSNTNIGDFTSLKQAGNTVNLIITEKEQWYFAFSAAAKICKKFNVMDKQTRIWVHEMCMGII